MLNTQDLRQIPLLSKLHDTELTQLVSVMRERRVPKGSFVFYADDPGPTLMFVSSGEVKITLISDEGKEIVLAILGPGAFFGEMAVLTGEDRSANAVALNDCVLCVLSAEDFREHLNRSSGLALAMLQELALRLRAASTKIATLALYDVNQRVARTLESLAVRHSESGKETLVIDKRPTHQELAAIVGTSREMVTRALKGLEEDGFIQVEGKLIRILKKLS